VLLPRVVRPIAENRFPAIWMPSIEQRDLRTLLRYRQPNQVKPYRALLLISLPAASCLAADFVLPAETGLDSSGSATLGSKSCFESLRMTQMKCGSCR